MPDETKTHETKPEPKAPKAKAAPPPKPPDEPAPPVDVTHETKPEPVAHADEAVRCVRVLPSGVGYVKGQDGKPTFLALRDVFNGDFATFLWERYPDRVERFPIVKE